MSCTASGRRARYCTAIQGDDSFTPEVLAPVWVLLSQSINAYSTSSVPLVGTSRFRRSAVYTECLRCAGAPRRPTSGSVLSLLTPSRHAILYDPEESIGCLRPVPSPTALAFTRFRAVRHSRVPHHPLPMGRCFRGFLVRYLPLAFATACRFARPPGGSDRVFLPANGDFYFRAFDGSVTLPAARYDYGGN
jgi:hypothetical protein